MGKLVIGPEGFVDLRKNPPPTTVTVQGFTPEPVGPKKVEVEMIPEPPAAPKEEVLPAIQKTAEGLQQSVAGFVRLTKGHGPVPPVLCRIESIDGPPCYAIVSKRQFDRLSRWQWHGTRGGYMFRKIKGATGVETVEWFHRSAAQCYRNDRYVAFLDNDERNCVRSNLKVCGSKEEAKAIRREALGKAAHG